MLVNYPLLDMAAAATGSPLLLTPGPFGGAPGPDVSPLTPEVSLDTRVPEWKVGCYSATPNISPSGRGLSKQHCLLTSLFRPCRPCSLPHAWESQGHERPCSPLRRTNCVWTALSHFWVLVRGDLIFEGRDQEKAIGGRMKEGDPGPTVCMCLKARGWEEGDGA